MRRIIYLITLCVFLGACAGTPKNSEDPYEDFNRGIYKFNKSVDKAVIKPVAYVYKNYTPDPLQDGVNNFFGNMGEVTTMSNDLLQFKIRYFTQDLARFLINSTVGILGLFDVASELGLERRKEDFGQTLYTWGYKKSAYLVLPILGPSTVRDTAGLTMDYFALSLWPWIESKEARYSLLGLNLIDARAKLLNKETILDTIALDEYAFVRDAYFQHRKYLATDGKSEKLSDDEMFDEM